jgi:D-proline reductase (dithiol) PrdB
LDHQSVGLIARTIEEAGISTIYLGSCRCMMSRVKPPRAAFINFPLGRQCGRPYDKEMQRAILRQTLMILTMATVPGEIVDLPYDWGEPFDWPSFMTSLQEMVEGKTGLPQGWKPGK